MAFRSAVAAASIVLATEAALAQSANKPAADDSVSSARHAIALVESGQCEQALSLLIRAMPRLRDKQLTYQAGMAEARCAMALNRQDTAVDALLRLRRDFPDDPQVLYIGTHYFSELAERSSQELAAKAPNSVQARRLEAEAFESQGKWDEAAGIYRSILARDPNTPGVHYRLGQVLLSKAGPSGPVDEAKAEFEKELQVDPNNAAAEFVLGELARRSGDWNAAAQHFGRATTLDRGFIEAYLALGMSLAAGGKYAEAIAPLETYVKLQPADPAGHYQLAIAYARTGNSAGAARETALQKEMAARATVPH